MAWSLSVELPSELLEALRNEAREAGAEAARAVLRDAEAERPPAPSPRVIRYARIRQYAQRVGVSPRTLHVLIQEGLPTIGEGRLRRVDVVAADAWLASRRPRRRRDG